MSITKTSLLTFTNNILQKIGESQIADVANADSGIEYNVLNYIDDILKDIYSRAAWPFTMTVFYTGTYDLHYDTAVRKLTLPDEINQNFLSEDGAVTVVASTAGAITALANNGGTIRCTDVGHGLVTGDVIYANITSGTSQSYTITRIDDDTFDLDSSTYVSTGTGTWSKADDTNTATNLSYTEPRQFFKSHPYDDNGSLGLPVEFTLVGRDVYLDPTPTANTYSLKIVSNLVKEKVSRASTGSTTYLTLPAQFEYVLEAGVMWCMYTGNDANKAAMWKTRYDENIQIMLAQYGLKQVFDERLK